MPSYIKKTELALDSQNLKLNILVESTSVVWTKAEIMFSLNIIWVEKLNHCSHLDEKKTIPTFMKQKSSLINVKIFQTYAFNFTVNKKYSFTAAKFVE